MHPKENYVRNAIKIDFINFIYEKKKFKPLTVSPCFLLAFVIFFPQLFAVA